jgi:hypothetical protein
MSRSRVAAFGAFLVLQTAACTAREPAHPNPPVKDSPPVRSALTPGFTPSPDLQHDVIAPDPGATGFQAPIDGMSWTTFVALSWPSSRVDRGTPDRNNLPGGRSASPEGGGGMPNGPLVWETFKNANDVFLNPPVAPTAWSVPDQVPAFCGSVRVAPGTKVMSIHNEAFADAPLNDQQGKNVWYEVRMNRREYDFIVDNKYYVSTNQPPVMEFPAGSNETSEVGALHVKAAWKEMTAAETTSGHFYVNSALLVDPAMNPPCRFVQSMGLVGLHIVHKTATRPQWIWSTFEQRENAPYIPQGGPPPTAAYTFYNPGCTVNCTPNTPPGVDQPVQVVRLVDVDAEAAPINQSYQTYFKATDTSKFTNVWQFYELVNAQWPAQPKNVSAFGSPVPTYLANTVLETYFQQPVAADPPHSCMNCHGTYTIAKPEPPFHATDFDFQLTKACPGADWCKAKRGVAALPATPPKR